MHEAVEAFDVPAPSNFIAIWQLAANPEGKAPQLRNGTPIPPRLRISEQVSAFAGPLRLRAAYLPTWLAAAGADKKQESRSAGVAIVPKPRVWMRTWNALKACPQVGCPADEWALVRNSYRARRKLQAEPMLAATPQPVLSTGRGGQVIVVPAAGKTDVIGSWEARNQQPEAKFVARPASMTPPQICVPGNLRQNAQRPDIAFTRGFFIWTKTPNSYARRWQPVPRLELCERVILPPASPAAPRRTLKESDIPADQKSEINRPRHASRSL